MDTLATFIKGQIEIQGLATGISDPSKLGELADDNFVCDKMRAPSHIAQLVALRT